jgi:hypothetical protein
LSRRSFIHGDNANYPVRLAMRYGRRGTHSPKEETLPEKNLDGRPEEKSNTGCRNALWSINFLSCSSFPMDKISPLLSIAAVVACCRMRFV